MNVKIGTEAARAISFLGINKWYYRCSAVGIQKEFAKMCRTITKDPSTLVKSYSYIPSVLEMETLFNFVRGRNGTEA